MFTGTIDKNKKSWRMRYYQTRDGINPDYELKKQQHPTEDDTVIKHPENGSNIRIKDNGVIQMFAANDVGIKIDPNSRSIQFFGNRAKFLTSNIHFETDDDGLMWNYMPFNDALTDPYRELITASRVPLTEISGTDTLKTILTSPGTYLSTTPGSPVGAGTISALNTMAVGLKGIPAYKGIRELNQIKAIQEGMRDIVDDYGSILE